MNTRKMALLALLVAGGILLSLLEAFIPVVIIIPGYKIGFANLCGLYALYAFGIRDMWIVNYLRIVLASLCIGTFLSLSFFISLCGSTLSMIAMSLLKRSGYFSIYGVSLGGAAFHTFGQVAFVCWIYQQYVFEFFMPFLIALALVSGILVAFFCEILLSRTRSFWMKESTA